MYLRQHSLIAQNGVSINFHKQIALASRGVPSSPKLVVSLAFRQIADDPMYDVHAALLGNHGGRFFELGFATMQRTNENDRLGRFALNRRHAAIDDVSTFTLSAMNLMSDSSSHHPHGKDSCLDEKDRTPGKSAL
jgi:hypothetical protein